ncbi:hypothetical protein K2173_002627 [Erythroxylum novogranatense]|uniref:Uncharacterized protein n=1 Tax=Erythroxylum novogranatense TaxID=1862640 RepID=A0AAV8SX10_9ROSI|nr:hypothetical protein K2173_002627 [Erythroxylum novogranatense]
MKTCKNFSLQSWFSIMLLFLSLTSAHEKPQVPPPPPPTQPSSSNNAPPELSSDQNVNKSSSGHVKSNGSSSINVDFKGRFSKVYAFGDSFTDTGNAGAMGGFKSFMSAVLGHSLFGQSGKTADVSGQRQCNGKLIVDYLCETLGIAHLQAYKQSAPDFSSGANFATSGATALSKDYFDHHKIANSLMWKEVPDNFMNQIEWFKQFTKTTGCKGKKDGQCKPEFDDALFWIGGIGGDDFARIFGSSVGAQMLTDIAVGQTCNFLEALIEMGAKFLVVQGLPPAGCCPLSMTLNKNKKRDEMGCSSSANAMIEAYNDLLLKSLGEMRNKHSGCVIIYVDTWEAYKAILKDYKQYKFVEPFKACCGYGNGLLNFDLNNLCGSTGTSACKNPDEHISWDGIHFTEAMNRHLADMFFTQKGYCHPSFDALIEPKKGL